MRRILVAILLLAAVAGAGWYWGSPWWTLRAMKQAAEARDVAALSAHIDYPALRAGMKRELRARASGGERGTLGALVAAGIADRLVDVAITPEGMLVVFAAAPLAARPAPRALPLNANDMALRRDALDRFRLVRRDGQRGALIFRLRGVRWLLSDVELPVGAL